MKDFIETSVETSNAVVHFGREANLENNEANVENVTVLDVMNATSKDDAVAKLVKIWENKNAQRAVRGAALSTMALSLAACGSDSTDDAEPAPVDPVEPTTPVEPVEPTVPVGASFVLDGSTDVTGTAGADTISGATATLSADTTLKPTMDIAGGEGVDTLNLTLGANFAGFTVTGTDTGSMTGVEVVNLSAADGVARSFDATGVSGVETYNIDGTNAIVNIADSADLSALNLSNIASGAFSITYTAATGGTSPVAGSADTLNLSVTGLGSSTADIGVTAAGVETLAITSNAAATAAGTTNYLDVTNVSSATSVTVSGAANTDLAAVSAKITSFDGSSSTGDITAALGNAAAGALTSVKTGSGADKVTAAYDDLTANATIDMGAGADTLVLTGAATAVSQFIMSGVETLDVTSVTGGATTVSMAKSDGAASTVVAGLGTSGKAVGYAGSLAFVGDTGAKNIDYIGAATGTITTDTTGAVDLDVTADADATAIALNTGGGVLTAASASSIDVSITGNVNQTGAISAAKATSATLTVSGAAQTATKLAAAKAETVTITTDKNVTLNAASDLSGAKIITIDTAGAFRDSSSNGFDAAATMTLSGAGTKAAATFDTLVGSTALAYSQNITATGLKAGLTFTGGIDAGDANLTVDVAGVTGAVNTGALDAAGTITVTASTTAATTLGAMTAKSVVINAANALTGVTFTAGNDITATSSVTIDGSGIVATDVDITASGTATAFTVDVDGGIAGDTVDITGGAKTSSITVKGDLGVGSDTYTVTLVDSSATGTVSVDMSAILADTTNQNAVTIDVNAESDNDLSITGTKGSNDTVEFGTTTAYGAVDVTLSGIEKVTFDDGLTLKAAALSGQTIALTGNAGGATVTLNGTAGADTISTKSLTAGANADLAIDAGVGNDTITLGAMVEALSYTSGADGTDTISGFTTASDTWTTDFAATTAYGAGVTADAASAAGAVTLNTAADAIFEITGTLQAAITDYTDGDQVLAAISGTSVSVAADTNKAIIVLYDNSNAYVYEAVEGADAGNVALAGDDLTLVAIFTDITAGSLAHGDIVTA